ncbi:MAG TPA: sugar phosphate isomerase/epimerase family protein [Phycisphaerae bacterium]|nr:sugar phosphate isomerase/epimerase family protein [Phycisphaerae bacterium]
MSGEKRKAGPADPDDGRTAGLPLSFTTDYAGADRFPTPDEYAAMADAGFRAIHWCQHWTGQPVLYDGPGADSLAATLRQCGLELADVHGYCAGHKDFPCTDELLVTVNLNRIEFAQRLGGRAVVLHLPPAPDAGPRGLARSRQILRALEPAARRAGVVLALENLPGAAATDEPFLDAVFSEFPPDLVGFCYDTGHALIASQTGMLRRYIGRLVVTHLHDNDGSSDQHLLPGRGKVDWPAVLGTIKDSAYAGTLNLEVHQEEGLAPDAFIRKAHDVLLALWEQC